MANTSEIRLLQFQLDALDNWANENGRGWKLALSYAWASGNYNGSSDAGTLQQIRNQFGPEWLDRFQFSRVKVYSLTN